MNLKYVRGANLPDIDGIDGYIIGRSLGAGPLGELWLAREEATGAVVTVRKLDTDAGGQERARRLFGVLDGFRHPGLVRIREMLPAGDDMIVVSDYVEGGTLADLLDARGMLDPGEVVAFAAPVARVLSVAHRSGLIHGSVSPQAIWLTRDGQPLLADLGLAGVLDPERPQMAGDIFAMSAICYTSLTGLRPGPDQPRRPLYMVAPGAPPGLSHVIEAGLQVDPEQRPDADELAEQVAASTPAVPIRMARSDQPEPPAFPPPATGPVAGPGPGGAGVQGPGPMPGRQSYPPSGPPSVAVSGPSTGPQGPGGAFGPGAEFGPPPRQPMDMPGPLRTIQVDDDDDDGSGKGRTLLLSALVFVVVAAIAVAGIWYFAGRDGDDEAVVKPTDSRSAEPKEPTPTPTPTPEPLPTLSPAEWTAILEELDQARAEAFAQMDPGLLDAVDAPDSTAYAADQKDIESLAGANVIETTGMEQEFQNLKVLGVDVNRVVVEADVVFSRATVSYSQDTQARCGKNPTQHQAIVLVREPNTDDWRISARSFRDEQHPSKLPPCPNAQRIGNDGGQQGNQGQQENTGEGEQGP